MASAATADVLDRARAVRLAIFDIDGVLTDGRLYFGAGGETLKVFHTLDGHGLKMLAMGGIATGLLSGRNSEAAAARARELRIPHVMLGVEDKLDRFDALCAELRLDASQCAFVGDDLPDLPVMQRCGLAVAVANAVQEVKAVSHMVTDAAGGHGAVREFCDFLLRAQGSVPAARFRAVS